MSRIFFGLSSDCSAFDSRAIGTRVVAILDFRSYLDVALAEHDTRTILRNDGDSGGKAFERHLQPATERPAA